MDASCVSITIVPDSIKSWIAFRKVKQLSVECPTLRWKLQKRFTLYQCDSGFGGGRTSRNRRSDATFGRTAFSGSASGANFRFSVGGRLCLWYCPY